MMTRSHGNHLSLLGDVDSSSCEYTFPDLKNVQDVYENAHDVHPDALLCFGRMSP